MRKKFDLTDAKRAQDDSRLAKQQAKAAPKRPRREDPLFSDAPVSKGLGTTDLSERHDEYLYGDDEGS